MTPLAKRLSIFLAISIGLNLLLAGLWLGHGLRGRGQHGFPPSMGSAESFNARRHPALRRAFEGKKPEFAAHRQASRAARNEVAQALTQEPFDRAAVERALSALRSENLRSQELLHGELVGMAERGSPELRRDIARTFLRERP
jgi:uncharacterized membrane protein